MHWEEIIGIVATVFVLISFLMKDVKTIRIVNIIGAALLVVYGALINSYSTWILNGLLIIIHLIYLIKILKNKKENKDESNNRDDKITGSNKQGL